MLMSSKSMCPGPHYHELKISGFVQALQTPHVKNQARPPHYAPVPLLSYLYSLDLQFLSHQIQKPQTDLGRFLQTISFHTADHKLTSLNSAAVQVFT